MNTRKEISRQYKERKLHGGVYTIINTVNGKYLIGHVADLASLRNRFQFSVVTGSTIDPRLRQDWVELGAQAFKLDVLEELKQGPDQTRTSFMDDLKTLEQLWRANLDASMEY